MADFAGWKRWRTITCAYMLMSADYSTNFNFNYFIFNRLYLINIAILLALTLKNALSNDFALNIIGKPETHVLNAKNISMHITTKLNSIVQQLQHFYIHFEPIIQNNRFKYRFKIEHKWQQIWRPFAIWNIAKHCGYYSYQLQGRFKSNRIYIVYNIRNKPDKLFYKIPEKTVAKHRLQLLIFFSIMN